MTPVSPIDLHMHTYYSDGRASPEEVVQHAAQIGMKTIAITDHDNVRGSREARPIATELGIELIPGIEFTTVWDGCGAALNVDLLGYFVDVDDPDFQQVTQRALDDIRNRIRLCCISLTQAGYPLSIDELYAFNSRYIGGTHLIFALIEKRLVLDWYDGLHLFWQHWEHIRNSTSPIGEIIQAIKTAGGVAVLAHPSVVDCGNGLLTKEQLGQLVDQGLDGVEVYHHRLDQAAQMHFLKLAKPFKLVVTGGSDEHGWQDGFPRMGSQPVTAKMVEALRKRRR